MHYAYEIIGGLLIFVSSVVTEEMGKERKLQLYGVLGTIVLVYILFGIALDRATDREQKSDHAAIQALTNTSAETRRQLDNALGRLKTAQDQLTNVQDQLSAVLKVAQNTLTKEQAAPLLDAAARASEIRDLRKEEAELSQKLRQFQQIHDAKIEKIQAGCRAEGKMRMPSCGMGAQRDENTSYGATFAMLYLPSAIALRDAMLKQLPSQTVDRRIAVLFENPEDYTQPGLVADYLDGLAKQLP